MNFELGGLDLGRNRRLRDPSQIGGGAMLRMRANHQLVPPSLPISLRLTDTEYDDTKEKGEITRHAKNGIPRSE